MYQIAELINPLPGIRIVTKNRYLLWQLVKRNISSRYRGSLLGVFWSFIQPLMMLCVYTFVFSVVFQARWSTDASNNRAAFAIILFCGMAVFNIFNESVCNSCYVVLGNPNYVKKVIFPLAILPVAQVLSSLIVGMIWFLLLFIGILAVFGTLYWTAFYLPLFLIPLVFISCGISFFVASLGVYIRDIQHLIVVIMQILYFMCPIFYPVDAVPPSFQWVMKLNPLTQIIEGIRKVLLYGQAPDWNSYAGVLILSMLLLHLGCVWFRKTQKGFSDVL